MIFLHGVPGSAEDATIAFGTAEGTTAPDYLATSDPLAQCYAVVDAAGDTPLHVAGFSIGAMFALRLAAARPDRVARLTLISAAAPLQLGDFLPQMAGRPVFETARDRPGLLPLLMAGQRLGIRLAPNAVLKQMFAGASAKELACLERHRPAILTGLKSALSSHPKGYRRALKEYVSDWSGCLSEVTCPVTLWHGEADTWAPIDMAEALADALPNGADINRIPDAGHYRALESCGAAMKAPS